MCVHTVWPLPKASAVLTSFFSTERWTRIEYSTSGQNLTKLVIPKAFWPHSFDPIKQETKTKFLDESNRDHFLLYFEEGLAPSQVHSYVLGMYSNILVRMERVLRSYVYRTPYIPHAPHAVHAISSTCSTRSLSRLCSACIVPRSATPLCSAQGCSVYVH